jgi:hypothetical protein
MFDKSLSRRACAVLVLVLPILSSFGPPQVLVYVDAEDGVNGVADIVAREACPYLHAEGVPLPVPFEVRWLRQAGESRRYVPDSGRRVLGFRDTAARATCCATPRSAASRARPRGPSAARSHLS